MKKVLSVLLATVMIIAIPFSFTGCKNSSKDDIIATVKLPDLNKETQCVETVANLAIQAHIDAMLKEAKFYALCEKKVSLAEIKAALDESEKAWETADVLSSSVYLMAKRLAHIERTTDYSNTKATVSFSNPFVMTAKAASTFKMEKFEDAKEWAEYINRIYDHGKVGEKTAYVAKILKTDVNRAKLAVRMANDILKGKEDLNAGYDDATVKLLLKTKAAGKVAGFTAATIASAGTTMGALGFAGYVAGGADAAIELTDTTLQVTLGEDHAFTKAFQDTTGKVAPIISVISFANVYNPEAWGGAVDAVGQFRFLTDSAVDLVNSNKLLGIEVPGAEGNKLKVIAIPKDVEFSGEEKEQLKEALTEMGYDEGDVEKFVNPKEAEKDEEAEEEQEGEKPFEELTVEEIDEKLEDLSISDEEWEELFKEVYNEYLEEMQDNGFLDDDDGIWDYDPFMPFEDFPQDGDEIGFDDLSMWAKPEKPFEDEETTTEPEEAEEETEEEEEETTETATEESTTEAGEHSIDEFMGTWYFTDSYGGEETNVTWSMKLSGNKIKVSTAVKEASSSFTCDYKFDGNKLTISGSDIETATFKLNKNGELVATADGETTVMHR